MCIRKRIHLGFFFLSTFFSLLFFYIKIYLPSFFLLPKNVFFFCSFHFFVCCLLLLLRAFTFWIYFFKLVYKLQSLIFVCLLEHFCCLHVFLFFSISKLSSLFFFHRLKCFIVWVVGKWCPVIIMWNYWWSSEELF